MSHNPEIPFSVRAPSPPWTMRYSGRNALLVAATLIAGSCHALRVGDQYADLGPAPAAITAVFAAQPDGALRINASDPGTTYRFDPSEKDAHFAGDDAALRFRDVTIRLRDRMPRDTVLADIEFVDGQGTEISVGPVDLLRLTPRLDMHGDMQYPEFLLEEYERFGVSFRREHAEFAVDTAAIARTATADATDRAYRLGIWNNCLDPTKWEMILFTEDYCDFDERLSGLLYVNQQRTLSHNWFYMNADLYAALMQIKNPHLAIDIALDYEQLSDRAEQVVIDFDLLRRIAGPEPIRVLEIGHQSGRKIEPIVPEQFYKWQYGLALNRDEFSNYRDVLDRPVYLAQFGDCGYYKPDEPKVFDFGWLRQLDRIEIDNLEVDGSGCYVQITLRGDAAPFSITCGNIDLALVDEQQMLGLAFGINPYPKTRRHNPRQDTIRYETDRMPAGILPYLMLTECERGTWINNQKHGLEKVFLGWETIDRDVLTIYVATYERILPVWMGRVKLSDDLVDRVRIRRRLYDY